MVNDHQWNNVQKDKHQENAGRAKSDSISNGDKIWIDCGNMQSNVTAWQGHSKYNKMKDSKDEKNAKINKFCGKMNIVIVVKKI